MKKAGIWTSIVGGLVLLSTATCTAVKAVDLKDPAGQTVGLGIVTRNSTNIENTKDMPQVGDEIPTWQSLLTALGGVAIAAFGGQRAVSYAKVEGAKHYRDVLRPQRLASEKKES